MKKLIKLTLFFTAIIFFNNAISAFAFCQIHHKKATSQALAYMGSGYATPEQKRAYDFYVKSAGSLSNAQELLGQAAYNVDDFMDTRLGGWWVGYHYTSGDLSLGLITNNYTSFWHFLNMTRGKDNHGNDHGGYSYRYRTNDPSWKNYDKIIMVWLYNQELKKDDYNSTEAHYRQGSYSSYNQYKDYQDIEFQPVDNLGSYWYNQFVARPTFQTIGYVTHAAADVGVAQHVWDTSSNYHTDYEEWLEDYHDAENLGSFDLLHNALSNYSTQDDLRTILTKTAADAYMLPDPLYNASYDARLKTAKIVIPKVMASIVTILTKAVNDLYAKGATSM